MDRRVDVPDRAVHTDHRRLSQFSADHATLAVHREFKRFSPLWEKSVIGKVSLHGGIHNRQTSVVVQFNALSVKGHIQERIALFIKGKTDADRRHEQGIFPDVRFQKLDLLHDFLAAKRHTLLHDAKLLGKQLCISGDLAASADDKHRADRLIPIEFADPVSDLPRHRIQNGTNDFQQLFSGDLLRKSHDILVGDRLHFSAVTLDLLRRAKIYQTVLGDRFGKPVACCRDHSVCHDAAALRDGDIGGSRSHIHKGDI